MATFIYMNIHVYIYIYYRNMYTSLRHFRAKTYRNKGFFTKKWKTLHCRFPARAAVFLHPFAVLLHVVCISCIKLRFSCTKMQLSCNSVAVFLQPCGSFPAHGCKKAATVRVKAATPLLRLPYKSVLLHWVPTLICPGLVYGSNP
jgi:hypothetical protein